jgi:catechol 2,3-dioxygenase-like lactoylglutathione lyase family enzyme
MRMVSGILGGNKEMVSSLGYDGGLTCVLQVGNLDESIAWYRDVLGFSLLYRMDDLGWCELATEVRGVNVGLSQVEKGRRNLGATLSFGVRELEKARRQLEGKGVRFDGPTNEIPGTVKLATLYDPDNNALMLYEDLRKKH